MICNWNSPIINAFKKIGRGGMAGKETVLVLGNEVVVWEEL